MGTIHVLDKALAELIAAGEVVERPASIAKELIENAIDAGATAIDVEIEGGGVVLLRVKDNGCGIPKKEISTAFLRHATSKVNTAADLESILTLGFRGEALASIAAMCKVELLTKTKEEQEGNLYTIEGGIEKGFEPVGCPTGTILTVRDVFYNTPARMKFLKKDVGEGNAVAQVVDKCALSHPEIAFRFVRDGKTRLQTSGGGELLPVIQAVYGKEFAASMIPVAHEVPQEGISVSGYITAPEGAKASRAYQNFFLNARYVRTRTAAAALEEACKTFVGHGKFPGCVLHIQINPTLVDVNVHPAKLEVRFVNERPVFSCVYFAVKSALTNRENGLLQRPLEAPAQKREDAAEKPIMKSGGSVPRMSSQDFRVLFGEPSPERPLFGKPMAFHASRPDIYVSREEGDPAHPQNPGGGSPQSDKKAPAGWATMGEDAGKPSKTPTVITYEEAPPRQEALEEPVTLRLIGEHAGTYILLERAGDLLLVDKHAAHERILYEKLKEDIAYGNRQVLLSPVTLAFDREEYGALVEHGAELEKLGFLVEDFGGSSVVVREVPIEMGERELASILGSVAAKLGVGKQDLTPDALDRLYYSIACKGAVRARDKNSLPELAAIVDKLARNPEITRCPHGRPVLVTLTSYDIEKLFGRQG